MQPEAKFKSKLREGFDRFYAAKPVFRFACAASIFQKPGLPDDYFAAEGKTAWIESKVDDGWLEKSQQLTIPQMVNAGIRVLIASADMRIAEDKRPVRVSDFNDGLLRRDRFSFQWADLTTHMFWRTALGIYV